MREKTDPSLGKQIEAMLEEQGIAGDFGYPDADAKEHITEAWATILVKMGGVPGSDIVNTSPARIADMFIDELFYGLNPKLFPKCTTTDNTGQTHMLLEDNIAVKSMCEHHFVPISGYACVAYIPKRKLLGLSKFNRIVDYFCRRPQVQERLTEQIYSALCHILGTSDVAVSIRADHFCVKHRGVQDINSVTTTTKLGGDFMNDPAVRTEFLHMRNKGHG